jgi:hypothetical protein
MAKFVVPYKPHLTWFEKKRKEKKRGFDFEFKLNQVHLSLIHCNYMLRNCRLHCSGYSDTMGVTVTSRGKSSPVTAAFQVAEMAAAAETALVRVLHKGKRLRGAKRSLSQWKGENGMRDGAPHQEQWRHGGVDSRRGGVDGFLGSNPGQ